MARLRYAKDALQAHRPPGVPSLRFDASTDAPPAFAKPVRTARDKFDDVERGALPDGRLAERYHTLWSKTEIEAYAADPVFTVQKLVRDFRRNATGLNIVDRVVWAAGDVVAYAMASPTDVVKQGSTRPRPCFSFMSRDAADLEADAEAVLEMDYRPRRLPFSYDDDVTRWKSLRGASEYYSKALGLDFAVFEFVRVASDVAVLLDANPTPLEEGFPWQALELQARGLLRRLNTRTRRHQHVVLARHALSTYNEAMLARGVDVGHRDAALSAAGRAQATALAAAARCPVGGVDVIYVSPSLSPRGASEDGSRRHRGRDQWRGAAAATRGYSVETSKTPQVHPGPRNCAFSAWTVRGRRRDPRAPGPPGAPRAVAHGPIAITRPRLARPRSAKALSRRRLLRRRGAGRGAVVALGRR